MLGLVFFIIAILCLIIGRLMLLTAAFEVSVWWGLALFLPFGQWLFLQNYPELTARSRWIAFAALPCVILGICLVDTPLPNHRCEQMAEAFGRRALNWFFDKADALSAKGKHNSSGPSVQGAPDLEGRRLANARELERLRAESEALRLRKRDLRHGDTEGTRDYERDLALYNEALAKAKTQRDALAAAAK